MGAMEQLRYKSGVRYGAYHILWAVLHMRQLQF